MGNINSTTTLITQPKRLEDFALNKFAKLIAVLPLQAEQMRIQSKHDETSAHAVLSKHIDILRNIITHKLPKIFYNKLGFVLIRLLCVSLYDHRNRKYRFISNVHKKGIERIIDILFNLDLTRLSFADISGVNMLLPLVISKSCMISGLVELDLNCSSTESDITETDIIQLLTPMCRLKCLKMHINCVMCTENVFKCITEHCKLIEDLTILSNGRCRSQSVDILILTQLSNLKNVILFIETQSKNPIDVFLMTCENIEFIIINKGNLIDAFERIASINNSDKKFKLQRFSPSDVYDITSEQLELVFRMCPDIQSVCLDGKRYKMYSGDFRIPNYNQLTPLKALGNLRELELERYVFNVDQIGNLLEIQGHNLVYLRFERIYDIDLHSLMYLCPNLETLNLLDCSFVEETSMQNKSPRTEEIPPLRYLKILKYSNTEHGNDTLCTLLSKCPNVEFVDVNIASIWNDVIFNVLDKIPMVHLKELKLNARITLIETET